MIHFRELSTKTILTITIVLVAIVMTSAFYFDGRFDIDTKEKSSKTLDEQTPEENEDLKIKAEKLMNAHNAIIYNFDYNNIPDPKDYGFDLDSGWTNTVSKQDWCIITENILFIEYQLLKELDEAINDIPNLDDIPKKLLENITEDKDMVSSMEDQQKLGHKMFIDFDCD